MTSASIVFPTPVGAPHFRYRNGTLHAEGVALTGLVEQLGSPLYVYSRAALRAAYEA